MTIKFNNSTYRALSNICNSIAQVSFAAFVTGVVLLPIDLRKIFMLVFELILSLGFWYLSIIFATKGKL